MIVYFDFLCPYAWRGLELSNLLGDRPELRHFSLVQGNHPENPDRKNPTWKLAEQSLTEGPGHQTASLAAFLAAKAAARQGDEAGRTYALHLMRLRHAEKRELGEAEVRLEAARRAGLDLARFEADLADEAGLRAELARDLDAAAQLGVFGTPTFVLDSGDAAYLRFSELPGSEEDARRLWSTYEAVLTSGARIETIKRPR
ncbi:DsbA family oxidoreductase [Deinococcus pimensis]|uniref:DsbA family oxidoreductase n=1 Tax=Deinococcus pimensis TaxID=309888 RepID=UPI00048508AA|nr:DsbA family protein [Deinococcus pimensis]